MLFHFHNYCSTLNNCTFLIIYTPYFSCRGSSNGMFHLHSTENDEDLVCLYSVTWMYLYFHDCSGHWCSQGFLRVGGAVFMGCSINIRGLAALQEVALPAENDLYLVFLLLYISAHL